MHQLECSGHGEHSSFVYSGLEFCVLWTFQHCQSCRDNCFFGIYSFLKFLPAYIYIGLIFNIVGNFLREETMANVECDIEIYVLKVKSEETLERREVKMTQCVKLELNLKFTFFYTFHIVLVLFSVTVMSDSLQPLELQHARLSCPSLSPTVCSNSCPLSQ